MNDRFDKQLTKLLKKININNKNTQVLLIKVIKFIIVGGIATVISGFVFYLCDNYLKTSVLISNTIAFIVSVIYNFWASVKWVFDVKEDDPKKQFIVFIVLSIIGLLINTAIVYVTIDILKWWSMICKVIATAIVMVFNFITRKIFLEKSTR